MALSDIDRNLLERCLDQQPDAWNDFVDRFTGLVLHVINHSAQSRSIMLSDAAREDLASEVMVTLVKDDYAVLRRFRGKSSLATYLTVIARRVVVRRLVQGRNATSLGSVAETSIADDPEVERRITQQDQVRKMLEQLDHDDAEVVRLFHLEGKSYQEISQSTGMPAGSVGPVLSRARDKLRQMGTNQPHTQL